MIDTPENIGIDDNDLINVIALIDEIGTEEDSIDKGQIILTTGINKYPIKYNQKVIETVTKKNKLLNRRVIDVGN